jgi:hypothetical protein
LQSPSRQRRHAETDRKNARWLRELLAGPGRPSRWMASTGSSSAALTVNSAPRRKGLVGVEQWAELRREHFVRGVSIKELARSRNTIRAALRSPAPPRYERASTGSKLDPFKPEIHRLLGDDATIPGQRIRELIAPLGFDGGKTIVDDYLRGVRPLFATPRTFQRTVYRPGEICQFDLWEPRAEVPVGHGQTRRAWVVVACLGCFVRRRRRACLLHPDRGSAVRDLPLPVVAGGAARDAGVGPPVRAARLRRPSDGAVRSVLRHAESRLVLLRAACPAGQGLRRAPAGLPREELRAGPPVRQRA